MYDLLVINQILGNGINRFAYDLKSTRCIMEGHLVRCLATDLKYDLK